MMGTNVSQSNITYMIVWDLIRKEYRKEKLSLQVFHACRLRMRNFVPSG